MRTRLGQVIGIALYQSATSFYCGDVRQYGAPLVCGTSVSRFESDTSHKSVTLSMLKRYKVFRLPTGLITSFV